MSYSTYWCLKCMIAFSHSDLGSSFWGMALILASTNLTTARIAAGCLAVALLVVLFIAKNVRFGHCSTFFMLLLNAFAAYYCSLRVIFRVL